MKKIFLIFALIAIVVVGTFIFNKQKEVNESIKDDHMNISYRIEGVDVKLKDGYAEESIPNSASKIITNYFGNELVTDLNGDGLDDIAFLITQQTGGTGTFYYLVVALSSEDGYIGSRGYFIGDRIAPQTINDMGSGVVVVNYAERREDEPMTAEPSIGKSLFLKLDDNNEWIPVKSSFSHPAPRDPEE